MPGFIRGLKVGEVRIEFVEAIFVICGLISLPQAAFDDAAHGYETTESHLAPLAAL